MRICFHLETENPAKTQFSKTQLCTLFLTLQKQRQAPNPTVSADWLARFREGAS